MNMPGLNAEASLFKTSGYYYRAGTFDTLAGKWEVLP